jgi:hypothetical protein
MSLYRCQREVSSAEFALWMAFYIREAEMADPDREPTPDELSAKMAAFAARGGA